MKLIMLIAAKAFALTAGVLSAVIFAFLALIAVMPDSCGHGEGLAFVNNSEQTIRQLHIELRASREKEQYCGVEMLKASGSLNCFFGAVSESAYYISGILENGASFQADNIGYIDGCGGWTSIITLDEDGVISFETNTSEEDGT